MKRVSMELGGHAPFIVFDDADPAHAAKGAAMVKFLNTGQACICPNRIYVQRSIVDAFVEALAEPGRPRCRPATGFTDGVQIGPLDRRGRAGQDRAPGRRRRGQGRHGRRRRAAACTDGDLTDGNFYAPTVLTDVTPDMVIYREETFGPVAPVIPFDDEDEVVGMANDTDYGLAIVRLHQRPEPGAARGQRRLDFGIVGINDINPTSAAAPFGGVKESGARP